MACQWPPRFPVYTAYSKGLPSTVYFARHYDLKEMTLAARLQLLGSHGVAPLVVMFGPFARVLNS